MREGGGGGGGGESDGGPSLPFGKFVVLPVAECCLVHESEHPLNLFRVELQRPHHLRTLLHTQGERA